MVIAHPDASGGSSSLLPLDAPTLTEDHQGVVTLPDLARAQELVDASGVVWHRRGGPVSDKRRRRLMPDLEVHVIHSYAGEIVEILPSEREAFWTAAELTMARSAYADFAAAEFKSERGGWLLAFEESC